MERQEKIRFIALHYGIFFGNFKERAEAKNRRKNGRNFIDYFVAGVLESGQ